MTTVNNTTGTSTNNYSSTAATDQTGLNNNFDQFLTLLTTQLQNQDPLSPMDSTQFTNQLVSFSQVEQQIKSNDSLNKLLTMQTLNMTALGVSFIGRDVQVAGTDFQMDGTKSAALTYTMPETATSGTLSITDKDGNVVYSQAAELSSGSHDFTWNGKDSSGNAVPAGTYKLTVSASNDTNPALNVTTYVPGHVTSLESADDGTLMLNVGGQSVPLTDVRQISEASST